MLPRVRPRPLRQRHDDPRRRRALTRLALSGLLRTLTPLRLLAAALAVALIAIVVLVTRGSAYYLEVPDEAHPLEGLVKVADEKEEPDRGGIYYVDVIVRRASLLEQLIGALRPNGSDLIPREAFTEPCISDSERFALNLADMRLSQRIASAVALRALGTPVRVRLGGLRIVAVTACSHARGILEKGDVIVAAAGKRVRDRADLRVVLDRVRVGDKVRLAVLRDGKLRTVAVRTTSDERAPRRPLLGVLPTQVLQARFPFRIQFDLGKVGGPSAGLAFALELLELRGRDVDHGLKVAATGEIQLDGSVTSIGGIKQKTIGARQADVDVFLVPVDGENARDARRYAHGLRIVPVESFQQALQALATVARKE